MIIEEKNKKKRLWAKAFRPERLVLFFILAILVILPLWMHAYWLLRPKTELKAVIIDKTVLTTKGNEHVSFTWLLEYYKYVKAGNEPYNNQDYYGFFPQQNEEFKIKGLEQLADSQIDSLSKASDMCYFTDTYGIYYNEWYKKNSPLEYSQKIYGGMSAQDIRLARNMKEQGKLVIAEFNTIASPTPYSIRKDFEQTFGIEWTGWTGRYFESLDTSTNRELPHWLTGNYTKQHNNKWPFKSSGLAFVNIDGRVEVLEMGRDLDDDVPIIYTNKVYREKFHLPPTQSYPYWFDIMKTERSNDVISAYSLKTTAKGDSVLQANGILKDFPAVIGHADKDYQFYYFAGDFADNPVSLGTCKLRGIGYLENYLNVLRVKGERESFFWRFYKPLMQKILLSYQTAQKKVK